MTSTLQQNDFKTSVRDDLNSISLVKSTSLPGLLARIRKASIHQQRTSATLAWSTQYTSLYDNRRDADTKH
jgi:hypothetical protein